MAILNDGINGGFTGKVGSVIGYRLHGKWVMKGLPKVSIKNKIGTEKQNLSRRKFTLMQKFLREVFGYIRIGFNLESKKRMMTAHNVAKSLNMLQAFKEDNTINFSKITLTYGNLAGAQSSRHFADDEGIHFTWDAGEPENYERKCDQVMLMAYSPEKACGFPIFSGARRRDGKETIEISEKYKGTIFHTWISFISDDRMSISMSTYIGEIEY